MNLPIFQVDAFTDTPFSGNPAAVVLLKEEAEAAWMQHVAGEMNLAETAFLHKQHEGYSLRWFTPVVEVDLCGHATLAGAHVLWETGLLKKEQEALFYTRSGILSARTGENGWIELNFPVEREQQAVVPEGLPKALGVAVKYIGKNRFDYLVEVESAETVRDMQPDFRKLKEICSRGVIVTARSKGTDFDFISRFFAPAVGIDEDPVTGSAHCCLGPFWRQKLGKDELIAYQASARGGIVKVRLDGQRVFLGGQAVTVLQGELMA